MPPWLNLWGEKKDEQAEVNVAELLEQVERQRAIIEEQKRQIEDLKMECDRWSSRTVQSKAFYEAIMQWLNRFPKQELHEVTE